MSKAIDLAAQLPAQLTIRKGEWQLTIRGKVEGTFSDYKVAIRVAESEFPGQAYVLTGAPDNEGSPS